MNAVLEMLQTAMHDARYAVRSLRSQPSFTLTVVLTLGLGIGATTTIFTLFYALVLRPLPVPAPERLAIVGDPAKVGWGWHGSPMIDYVSYPLYQDVNNANHVFSDLYASGSVDVDLIAQGGDPQTPEHPNVRVASGNFFTVLGLPALAGRVFNSADDQRGAQPVAVLSYAYWRRRFGGERLALGSTLRLNGVAVTVIGIGPRDFTGDVVGESTDIWLPMSVVTLMPDSPRLLEDRSASWLQMMGRLAPGVTLDRARAEITTAELRAVRSHLTGPSLTDFDHDVESDPARVEPGARGFSSQRAVYTSALAILMTGVALLALVVCANIANLTLARAIARDRELTVRMTLGAARRRLIAQLLTESTVLGASAGAVGLLASSWGTSGLIAAVDSVTFLDVFPDGRVLAFTAGVTALSVLLFGFLPALRATRLDVGTTLRGQGRGMIGGRALLARSLVSAQIALSTLLLIGAGLLVHSARQLLHADLGFDRDHVAIAHIRMGKTAYVGQRLESYRQAVERQTNQVPGVLGASYSQEGIFSGGVSLGHVAISGVVTPADTQSSIYYDRVGAGFTRATGAAVLRGRDFDASDEQPGVNHAMIDATMARAYFANRDPIGQRIDLDSVEYTVVGVVRDLEERDVREARVRRMYLSQPEPSSRPLSFELIVRTAGDPSHALASISAAVRAIDPSVPFDVQPLTQRLRESIRESLLLTNLTLAFGLATLIIAALGLYGVTAYATSRRTNEFGLRMALGAPAVSVTTMVLREALTTTAIGVGVGLPAAIFGTRLIRSQVFGVGAVDPPSLTIAVATLALTAVMASWLPARRAAAASPLDALKAE